MLIYRNYNEEKRLDRAWYKSSNIIYSECDDNLNDYKTLRVVFKNGSCYEYRNISVQDYLMFMYGDIDGSNGKALNKFIKSNKYEYVRLENKSIDELNNELNLLLESERKNAIAEYNDNQDIEDTKKD